MGKVWSFMFFERRTELEGLLNALLMSMLGFWSPVACSALAEETLQFIVLEPLVSTLRERPLGPCMMRLPRHGLQYHGEGLPSSGYEEELR